MTIGIKLLLATAPENAAPQGGPHAVPGGTQRQAKHILIPANVQMSKLHRTNYMGSSRKLEIGENILES